MVKLLKKNCSNYQFRHICHQEILLDDPAVTSVLHIQGNHILCTENDYDLKGRLKDDNIHDLAWELGGIKKFDKDNKEIIPRDVKDNPLVKTGKVVL